MPSISRSIRTYLAAAVLGLVVVTALAFLVSGLVRTVYLLFGNRFARKSRERMGGAMDVGVLIFVEMRQPVDHRLRLLRVLSPARRRRRLRAVARDDLPEGRRTGAEGEGHWRHEGRWRCRRRLLTLRRRVVSALLAEIDPLHRGRSGLCIARERRTRDTEQGLSRSVGGCSDSFHRCASCCRDRGARPSEEWRRSSRHCVHRRYRFTPALRCGGRDADHQRQHNGRVDVEGDRRRRAAARHP